MKIATWNVNSLRVRLPQVLDWLRANEPDLLALQETKVTDDKFPSAEIEQLGYTARWSGQKTYNGVALVARGAIGAAIKDLPGLDDPDRRFIAATVGAVRVVNLYVVNGQAVGSEKFAHKLRWLEVVRAYLATELRGHRHLVVVGDFNIAPADRDVHDPDAWREQILCSTEERQALRRIVDLGLVDTFRLFEQAERSYSWWDYRAAGFRRNLGLRLDLVLASAPLAEACTSCLIDKHPRGLERPSDHAPVVAEFDLPPA